MIATALLTDLLIVTTLRDPSLFHLRVLDAFAAINMSLLALDLAVTLLVLRKPSKHRALVQELCVAVEAFTIVVWIQVTGSVSSYFLLIGPVAILGYRFFLGYRVGVVVALSFAVCHIGA